MEKPIYSVDDQVTCHIVLKSGNRVDFEGTIATVDEPGSIPSIDEPSYDVFTLEWPDSGIPTTVKHVRQSQITIEI